MVRQWIHLPLRVQVRFNTKKATPKPSPWNLANWARVKSNHLATKLNLKTKQKQNREDIRFEKSSFRSTFPLQKSQPNEQNPSVRQYRAVQSAVRYHYLGKVMDRPSFKLYLSKYAHFWLHTCCFEEMTENFHHQLYNFFIQNQKKLVLLYIHDSRRLFMWTMISGRYFVLWNMIFMNTASFVNASEVFLTEDSQRVHKWILKLALLKV